MASARVIPSVAGFPPCRLLLQFSFLISVCLISLSDGASVKFSGGDDAAKLESLASSRILMDRTTSSSHITSDEMSQLGIKSSLSSRPSPRSTKILKRNKAAGNKEERNKPPTRFQFISPLHVAQCRATCLQKLTETSIPVAGVGPTPTSVVKTRDEGKGEEKNVGDDDALSSPKTGGDDPDPIPTTDEIYFPPKLLRLKRRKGSPSKDESTILSCSQNVECLSCWESCPRFQILGRSDQVSLAFPQKVEAGANEATAPENFSYNLVFNGAGPLDDAEDDQMRRQTKTKKQEKSKQSNSSPPSCPSLLESNHCIAGCQVACSFYDRLFTSHQSQRGNGRKFPTMGSGKDPVVATKQESLLEMVPGKLTWPGRNDRAGLRRDANQNEMMMTPVVFMVIQEYPDRKWRQIAQTTKREFSIPKELTSGMKTKLQSVRILEVGPEGLLSVYTSNGHNVHREKSETKKLQYQSNNSTNMAVVEKEEQGRPTEIAVTEFHENDKENGSESVGEGYREPEILGEKEKGLKEKQQAQTDYITESPKHNINEISSSSSPVSDSPPPETNSDIRKHTEEPFELRIVSLIHQKSLDIAELKWNGFGGNPNQEYLITWELTGGGLKGHLVTDSTSVTLSLWPGTTYQIQVEVFEQNLDSDGEQPVESSPTSLKSLPLIVDTTEASFPTGSSPTLQKPGEEEHSYDREGHVDEDEFLPEPSGNESEDEEKAAHKSFMNLPTNLSLFLSTTAISAMLILVTLTVVAYIWTRLRLTSAPKLSVKKVDCCFSGKGMGCCDSSVGSGSCGGYGWGSFCCFTHPEKEPQLLSSHEDLSPESSSPFFYAVEFKRSQQKGKWRKKNKTGMLQCSDLHQDKVTGSAEQSAVATMPVAVISSNSSLSSGGTTGPGSAALFNYYSYKDGLLPSCRASPRSRVETHSVGTGPINVGEVNKIVHHPHRQRHAADYLIPTPALHIAAVRKHT